MTTLILYRYNTEPVKLPIERVRTIQTHSKFLLNVITTDDNVYTGHTVKFE